MELSEQEMESFLPFSVIGSKKFFHKSIHILSNDSKMGFRNRKLKYFSPFQSSYKNTYFTEVSLFGQTIPNWFSDMELSKQEMELFLPLPGT
jgi:hypothetical protein